MGRELSILDKETYECWIEKKCRFGKKTGGPCGHTSFDYKYNFCLKELKNVFIWISREVPNIPHGDMHNFFDYEEYDDKDWEEQLSYKSTVEEAQSKFKKLRKMAQENLDYLKEHKIDLKNPSNKETLENILKIPVEEVYCLDVG